MQNPAGGRVNTFFHYYMGRVKHLGRMLGGAQKSGGPWQSSGWRLEDAEAIVRTIAQQA